jgi:hypothetical protein
MRSRSLEAGARKIGGVEGNSAEKKQIWMSIIKMGLTPGDFEMLADGCIYQLEGIGTQGIE